MAGIYITKGMTLALPKFSISIRGDGTVEAEPVVLHVRYDVCPTWMKLTVRHLEVAVGARTRR